MNLRDRKGGWSSIIWLDKYRIISMLGGSGNGEVFLAEHEKLQTKRIIKRIRRNHPFYLRLSEEVKILRMLEHPGIPRLYDVEEDERYLYLIEEFIEGISLKDLILTQCLREQNIILIMLQICNIIQYLHQQNPPIYYLDWKPEHVLLSGGTVRLIDFGSAISAGEKQGKQENLLCLGTEGYAPPELYQGEPIGAYCDVYGIGSMLSFLMDGGCEEKTVDRKNRTNVYLRGLRKIKKVCMYPEKERRWRLEEVIAALEKLDRTGKDRSGRLWSKRKGEIASRGKLVIGLIGIHPGAGVTHISFLLAHYLAYTTGESVAYVECNRHGDCDRLQKRQTTGNPRGGLGKSPELYPEVSTEELPWLLNREHAYFVIDFGCEWEEHLTEYLHCGVKIVVAQLREWKVEELDRWEHQEQEYVGQRGWHYLYNLWDDRRKADGRGRNGIAFPCEYDIRHPSAEAAEIFQRLLSESDR